MLLDKKSTIVAAGIATLLAAAPTGSHALTLGLDFAALYTLTDLGSVPGVDPVYGGMVFKAGDPNTILLGGVANEAVGKLYEVPVIRDGSNHIIGLGVATQVGVAPFNDGGFAYGPGGVLFLSQWPANMLSQYKPGNEAAPDKVIDLTPLGIASSHASLGFVPAGFAGAGKMKANSWEGGEWYTLAYAPDGTGTFDILSATLETTLPGGPEGFVFVSGLNPGFLVNSLLIAEYSAGNVVTYELDANGDPLVGTRRIFIEGLEGAEGATFDPLTGDFLFSTFGGGDRIVVVQGFTELPPPVFIPEPMTLALFGLGLAGLGIVRHRKTA